MNSTLARAALGLLLALALPAAAGGATLETRWEQLPLAHRPASFTLQLAGDDGAALAGTAVELRTGGRWLGPAGEAVDASLVTGEEGELAFEGITIEGERSFRLVLPSGEELEGSVPGVAAGWTLLPPLLAILLALWLRQVLLALAAGVLGGAWLFYGNPADAYLEGLRTILVGAVTDEFQASILIFTAALGGVVGVMAAAGGTHGLVDLASRGIKDARGSQFATAMLGLLVFFDDYANTLLVGNTMRPVTDRMRVSREKLSYLVDSTAAPIATIALLSTWVGFQVGLISDGLESIGRPAAEAYSTFFAGIPYSTYPWFALFLVFWVVLSKRDFGPMLGAERRARTTGKVLRDGARPLADDIGDELAPAEGAPRHARLALVPIAVVLFGTVLGLWYDGRNAILGDAGTEGLAAANLQTILSNADPAATLLWAVFAGTIVVVGMAVGSRVLDLQGAIDAWTSGAKAMLPALMILVLAWSIGTVCEQLGTAGVVVGWATGNLDARVVPTVIFVVAAFLGFSTGSSWGTMAILMPIAIPMAAALPEAAQLGPAATQAIFLSGISSVLAGSVLGDHCSPISDTTIMSSMASGADHVDHVRTQMPYALAAGGLAILLGTLPAGFGIHPFVTLPVGALALGGVVFLFGRDAEA